MVNVLLFSFLASYIIHGYTVDKYALLMPYVRPDVTDLYLCTPVQLNPNQTFFIVGFEPNATMNTAHHMVLYGCTTPFKRVPVWDCGGIQGANRGRVTSICATGTTVLYAWARNAPKLELPTDVGFRVGGNTAVKYLVLSVHYNNIDQFKDGSNSGDDSGVFIHYTDQPVPKLAGIFTLGAAGFIRPMTEEHVEMACRITEKKTMHAFAFRVHAHKLGKMVSGYVVRTDKDGRNHWTLIGKKDPLLPEWFYPAANLANITEGDIVAARCTTVSNRRTITYNGERDEDEMCNFYIMYYLDEGVEPLEQKFCFSRGSPFFFWQHFLNNIPKDASYQEN